MEEFILDFVNFVSDLDFALIMRTFFMLFIVFWLFIVVWVWFDASDRSNKVIFRIFSIFLTLFLNILGLIIYFLIRPEQSYEERYWQELEKKYLEFETCGLTNCSFCGVSLEPSFVHCPGCGKNLKAQCDKCGEFIEKYWKFCSYCGLSRNSEDIELDIAHEKEQSTQSEDCKADRGVFKKVCKVGENQRGCIQRVKRFLKYGDEGVSKNEVLNKSKTKKGSSKVSSASSKGEKQASQKSKQDKKKKKTSKSKTKKQSSSNSKSKKK